MIKSILGKATQEKSKIDNTMRAEIYSHPMFNAINEIIKQSDKILFETAKEFIGKSLREDFTELSMSPKVALVDENNDLRVEIE
jgi:hypothetical protein